LQNGSATGTGTARTEANAEKTFRINHTRVTVHQALAADTAEVVCRRARVTNTNKGKSKGKRGFD